MVALSLFDWFSGSLLVAGASDATHPEVTHLLFLPSMLFLGLVFFFVLFMFLFERCLIRFLTCI